MPVTRTIHGNMPQTRFSREAACRSSMGRCESPISQASGRRIMATTGRALPWVTARGGPYERGLQHGQQCGDLIARYADTLLQTIRQEAAWRGPPLDFSLG